MLKRTSIIIVNYNGSKVITQCLESLKKQTDTDFEVLIVDNASTDDSLLKIRQFPWVKLIKLESNLGFTGGNIEGLMHATGKYICLLNPDTEVYPNWLENLCEAMERDMEIGICASKLVVYDNGMIDSAGDGCTTTGKGYKRGDGLHSNQFQKEELVFGACGGAMLIRRSLINEIGFLDNDFFLIHEDTDFNFRAQLAGWKCLFVPGAVVLHKVRSSIGHMSDMAVYYSVRNARYVLFKNMPVKIIVKYFIWHLVQELGSILYFVCKHKKLMPYLRANWDFLKEIPALLSKRREVKKIIKISEYELENMLTPVNNPYIYMEKWRKLILKGK
ncbi:glycosyltransferase family 2 protein [Pelosinus sp. IPA-1]|uniref:glycosyltransferase family 2 protein n=1 Tax=Pelosinus sp. IPA-1 TaxID=3029569 RepID=UPI00243622D1|nr:glycosyltransferase family 2 protein [Pelosinus sp. IPA-1]GMB01254.1 glycosyl transferase [Pelosinus sp. IPA-1]